jgi:hypothetical protein
MKNKYRKPVFEIHEDDRSVVKISDQNILLVKTPHNAEEGRINHVKKQLLLRIQGYNTFYSYVDLPKGYYFEVIGRADKDDMGIKIHNYGFSLDRCFLIKIIRSLQ